MVNRADFKFGLISVVIESDTTNTVELTNLAFNSLKMLLPDAKNLAKLERRAKREEQKSMTRNMLLLKNKAICDTCEDDSECDGEDACPKSKKLDEVKNLYV